MVIPRASYVLSKSSSVLLVQLLATQTPIEELQVVTFHPGTVFGAGWEAGGITEDMAPFDNGKSACVYDSNRKLTLGLIVSLPGAFAVWAASKEAEFANGRVLWASWDVEELASGDVAKRIKEDVDYLRVSVVGIRNMNRSPAYV